MYYILAIFIFFEILNISIIPKLFKDLAFNNFLKKIKQDKKPDFHVIGNINKSILPTEKNGYNFIAFYYIFVLIFFIIGLFYPFWHYSIIILSMIIINIFLSKLINDKNLESFLDLNEFNDDIIPQKLKRKIKINGINNNYKRKKILYLTKEYIMSILRLAIYIIIIIAHQNNIL